MHLSYKQKAAVLATLSALPVGLYLTTNSKDQFAGAADKLAANQPPRHSGQHGPPFDKIAKDLGVSNETLKKALTEIRQQTAPPAKPDRDALAQELATKLGVSAQDLTNAMEKLRSEHQPPKPNGKEGSGPDHHGMQPPGPPPANFVNDLAQLLNIDAAKITTAFQELETQHAAKRTQRFDQFANELAQRIQVSANKIKRVFQKYLNDGPGPFFGPGKDHPHGPMSPGAQRKQHNGRR